MASRAVTRIAAVAVGAVALSGCVSKQIMERAVERVETKERPAIAAEMAEVIARVTEADLAECKRIVEEPTALGATFRLKGPLRPNAQSTCVTMTESFMRDRSKKIAAYTAPVSTGGVAVFSGAKIFGCTMVLEDGKITVRRGAAFKAQRNSMCHMVRP